MEVKRKTTWKTAFNLNILTILFFIANAIYFDIMLFYIIAVVFLTILPACSTKN